MIERVILVGQGENDIGFLEGLRDRLGCEAESVTYLLGLPRLRQRGHFTLKRDAARISEGHPSADLIVRLTDGDADRPQDAYREELRRWPASVQSKLVCGVCDRDIEHWMCLDPDYAARRLCYSLGQLPKERKERTGFLKGRIDEMRGSQSRKDYVARFVREAPKETVLRWLANPAFRHFYDQCRDKAQQHDCVVANLRD